MLSASEAKKKSSEILEMGLTEDIRKVEILIETAITEGKFAVIVNGVLKHETTVLLKKLGYVVEVGGRYNEIDTVIKW